MAVEKVVYIRDLERRRSDADAVQRDPADAAAVIAFPRKPTFEPPCDVTFHDGILSITV